MPERFDPRGVPIEDDDDAIARALADVSVPTLVCSLVHLTGDARLLESLPRPNPVYLNEVQGFLSEPDKAAIRARALELIRAFRDSGCRLPPPPPRETIHAMMRYLVGQDVPAEYVPMMLEEMELDGRDQRGFHWHRAVAAEAKAAFPVVVIGGGEAGLLMGI